MVFFTVCLLGLMVSAAFGATSTTKASCPQNAAQLARIDSIGIFENTCFLLIDYDSALYETALEKCQKSGGTLAMPKTKDVNDFLLQMMKKNKVTSPMWIGMNDKGKEGKYVWEDGTEVKAWGNMNSGNGGIFNPKEDCIALNSRDNQWHDFICSPKGFLKRLTRLDKLPYICQYSLAHTNQD